MVSHWSLSDSKSSQFLRIVLCILNDLNNAVVWMVSTRHLISKSSSPCMNALVTAQRAPITIEITVTFMFHSFFHFPGKVFVHIPLLAFFLFYSVVNWDSKVHNSVSSLFLLLTIIRSGRLAEIRWSVCISKSQQSVSVSFSRTDSELCIYNLFTGSNSHFLHNFQ